MTRTLSMAMVLCLVVCEGLAQAAFYERPKVQLPGPHRQPGKTPLPY